eukprot:m.975224 g.975224  ORF g.975224 m.975224 type:complete len:78 (-) comp23938_c0_seq54:3913-4146(-)
MATFAHLPRDQSPDSNSSERPIVPMSGEKSKYLVVSADLDVLGGKFEPVSRVLATVAPQQTVFMTTDIRGRHIGAVV